MSRRSARERTLGRRRGRRARVDHKRAVGWHGRVAWDVALLVLGDRMYLWRRGTAREVLVDHYATLRLLVRGAERWP